MNVQLQYDIDMSAAFYMDDLPDFESRLQLNQYSISLQLITVADSKLEINIAMERLKTFVNHELANTIFINRDLEERALILNNLGVNVTTLPDDPVDQIIGIMLFCKLNAVMEGRMRVTRLDIASVLGDNVWYQHTDEDVLGPFVKEGWWHQPTLQHETVSDIDTPNNVVKVERNGWIDYNLMWPESAVEPTANTVVYADFSKNEN